MSLLGLAAALLGAGAREARAQAGFALTLSANQNFSWTGVVDPSSSTAKTTYYLLRKFGGPTTNPLSGGTTIAVLFDGLTINFNSKYPGSQCYVVRASGPVSGIFSNSNVACHSYMHNTANGNESGALRTDGNGTQLGFNNLWKFTYYLDQDALVTMKIYSPSTTITTDGDGFTIPANPDGNLIKTVLSSAPRSGELFAGSVSNEDFWDSRNSSGALVQNGLYLVHFTVTDPLLTNPTNRRYSDVFTVPVDTLRITQFTTQGITAAGGSAAINYTITSAASVRIVIARPGRQFVRDGNGDIQSLNAAGTAIDTSTTSVVQVITFNRSAGANSETWNGTDSLGVAVSSGVYVVGISAKDSFGNEATGPANDQQPIQGTIPVDRTASQQTTDTTAPTVSSVTVGATQISLAGGTAVSAFTSIVFTLSETAGTGSNISVVSLTGPGGAIAGGAVSASGNTVTYSTGTTQSSTGTYTVTITARDALGNASSPQSYTFNIPAPTAPTVSSITINGTSLSLAGGTNVTAFTTISIFLSATAGTGANTSTVTLVFGGNNLAGTISMSGNVITYSTATTIASTGTYTLTISPRDDVGTAGSNVPVTFVIPTPTASTSPVDEDAFKASVKPFPNPARGNTPMAIQFQIGSAATVDFDLYTLSGQRVFHQTRSYAAGTQTFNWTLANDSGNAVSSGVYLLKITANDGQNILRSTKKVMVLK